MTKLGSPIDACAMTSKVRFSRSYATCSDSAAPVPSECTLIWVQCQHTLIINKINKDRACGHCGTNGEVERSSLVMGGG